MGSRQAGSEGGSAGRFGVRCHRLFMSADRSNDEWGYDRARARGRAEKGRSEVKMPKRQG